MGIDDDDDVGPPVEEFNREDGELSTARLWIAPAAEITNEDVLLLLLPVDAADAAARLENRMLADAAAVANEKMIGDEKRIWELIKEEIQTILALLIPRNFVYFYISSLFCSTSTGNWCMRGKWKMENTAGLRGYVIRDQIITDSKITVLYV